MLLGARGTITSRGVLRNPLARIVCLHNGGARACISKTRSTDAPRTHVHACQHASARRHPRTSMSTPRSLSAFAHSPAPAPSSMSGPWAAAAASAASQGTLHAARWRSATHSAPMALKSRRPYVPQVMYCAVNHEPHNDIFSAYWRRYARAMLLPRSLCPLPSPMLAGSLAPVAATSAMS